MWLSCIFHHFSSYSWLEEIWGEMSAPFCLPRTHVTLLGLPLGFCLGDPSPSPTVTPHGLCGIMVLWLNTWQGAASRREKVIRIRVWRCGLPWQKLHGDQVEATAVVTGLWGYWLTCGCSHVGGLGSREGGDFGTHPFSLFFSTQSWTPVCVTVPPSSWWGRLSPELSFSRNVITDTHKMYVTNTLGVS